MGHQLLILPKGSFCGFPLSKKNMANMCQSTVIISSTQQKSEMKETERNQKCLAHSLKLTCSPLKMDGWNTTLLLGRAITPTFYPTMPPPNNHGFFRWRRRPCWNVRAKLRGKQRWATMVQQANRESIRGDTSVVSPTKWVCFYRKIYTRVGHNWHVFVRGTNSEPSSIKSSIYISLVLQDPSESVFWAGF